MKKKSLSKLKADLQKVFNKFIRLRDGDEEGMGNCISCGEWKKLQAGHYFSVKRRDALRFDELNVNGECAGCNCFDDTHLIGYRKNLVRRYGEREVILLEQRGDEAKKKITKWTRLEIESMIEYYKDQVRHLEGSD